MEYQVVILTFWTILIKHDEVENIQKIYIFSEKTQKCESKNGCVAGVIRDKVWNGSVVVVKCVQSLGGGGRGQ